jgi:hypothetical protein
MSRCPRYRLTPARRLATWGRRGVGTVRGHDESPQSPCARTRRHRSRLWCCHDHSSELGRADPGTVDLLQRLEVSRDRGRRRRHQRDELDCGFGLGGDRLRVSREGTRRQRVRSRLTNHILLQSFAPAVPRPPAVAIRSFTRVRSRSRPNAPLRAAPPRCRRCVPPVGAPRASACRNPSCECARRAKQRRPRRLAGESSDQNLA